MTMVKRGDSRVVSSVSLKFVKPYKIGLANHSGPPSSSFFSKSRINIDLNELPSDSGKEEPQSSLSINIDLNELPYDSEREEPQMPPRNLSLLGDCNISKNPPNPKSKPYTSSNKRPLVKERGRRVGYKKTKKLRREALFSSPPPSPEWLLQVMSGMNGAEDARLIYEKTLFVTDVNPTQSRLLISFEELIRNDFLTQAEARTLVWCGMKTILINQRSEKWDLVLKRWVMKKKDSPNEGLSYYTLNRGWNNVVNGNGLKAGDNISLWSFRCRGVLCFALFTSPPTLGQSSSSATS